MNEKVHSARRMIDFFIVTCPVRRLQCVWLRLRWQAANHGCHCFDRAFLLALLGRSSGNHDWLLANASACVSCGFRLRNARKRTQRKRLRLNGNRALAYMSASLVYSLRRRRNDMRHSLCSVLITCHAAFTA